MNAPLLILYGSQTGNAQDVAERIGREAALRLFSPRVLSMDSYDVSGLPTERLVVCVASTTGQGDPPDNMRRFWRFLLRRSLPPNSLSGGHFAVFGLGDSGYPNYNVVAKKLDRRLAGLGAHILLKRGLGDDQHANGYEAALDPWLSRLWPALRSACPLPPGVQQPELTEEALLALGPPKYRITQLEPAQAAEAAEALAARLRRQQPHVAGLAEAVRSGLAAATAAAGRPAEAEAEALEKQEERGGGIGGLAAAMRLAEAVAASADFRRLALYVAGAEEPAGEYGGPSAPPPAPAQERTCNGGASTSYGGHQDGTTPYSYGPWRPYLARLAVNRRITAAGHFQDTRHMELDLGESGLTYEPGDLVAILPMTSDALVDAFLARLGLDGEAWVRVEAAGPAPGPGRGASAEQHQQQGQPQGQQEEGRDGSPDASDAGPCVVARIRSLVQGCLDVAGASPRRYFFQVLRHFVSTELERERLSYFATAEGRDDLYRYNQREGRTVLEVLSDFRSASPPLERLLEAAPPLRPRLFSAAASQRLRGVGAVHLLAALVSYRTPNRRTKTGLCSGYLAGLDPEAAAAAGQEVRVAVWTEPGSLRPPRSLDTPLILIGPGTGVAPFRSFLEDRQAVLLEHQRQQQLQGQDQDQQGGPQQLGNGTAAAADGAPANGAASLPAATAAAAAPAPCHLFFGCRSRSADFYYAEQWEQMARMGVLHPTHGLVTAFSRDKAEAAAAAEGGAGGGGAASGGKVYVTHRIREHGALLWRLLTEGGACVFVSGSAKRMPADVAAAFADVAAAHGGMDKEAGAAFVRGLEAKGRYRVEAWS